MNLHELPAHDAGLRGEIVRDSYLIDRFRVVYEFGGGWACGCREFALQDACKHTREAVGRRAAQRQIVEHLARGRPEAFSPVRMLQKPAFAPRRS